MQVAGFPVPIFSYIWPSLYFRNFLPKSGLIYILIDLWLFQTGIRTCFLKSANTFAPLSHFDLNINNIFMFYISGWKKEDWGFSMMHFFNLLFEDTMGGPSLKKQTASTTRSTWTWQIYRPIPGILIYSNTLYQCLIWDEKVWVLNLILRLKVQHFLCQKFQPCTRRIVKM